MDDGGLQGSGGADSSSTDGPEGCVASLESIGARLKREREARGLSVEEAAKETRIQRSYLEAIEQDDFDSLPTGPFLTGFISSYARYLGLPVSDVIKMVPEREEQDFAKLVASHDPDRRGPRIEIRELPVGAQRSQWITWALSIGAIGIIGGGLLYGLQPSLQDWWGVVVEAGDSVADGISAAMPVYDKGSTEKTSEAPGQITEPRGEVHEARADQAGSDQSSAPSKTSEVGNQVILDGASTEDVPRSEMVNGQDGLQQLTPIQSEQDGEFYTVYRDTQVGAGTPQRVLVKALHKSYVRVSATLDGQPTYQGVLTSGETKDITFPDDLWLVVGNAGGVEILYNGRPLTDLGRYGERRGFAFQAPER